MATWFERRDVVVSRLGNVAISADRSSDKVKEAVVPTAMTAHASRLPPITN